MTLLDRAIASALPRVPKPIVHQVAKRYIAGETTADAVRVASQLNEKGLLATMDILGEHVETLDHARRAVSRYIDLLQVIHDRQIQSGVSIKLTQFGLKVDKAACLELTETVVEKARSLGNFVRIDMEDSSCTSDTLDVYRTLRKAFSNVGVVIQAYLRRTLDDVAQLADLTPNYRLCKGVYVEPAHVAYPDMPSINRNFVAILEQLFKQGSHVGIATHDAALVREAYRLIDQLKVPKTAYEFHMLLGVREDLRARIVAAGHPLRVYIPFGPDWYAYSVRRLRENPKLAGYVLKAFFTR
jgi:proline dehydrogenase